MCLTEAARHVIVCPRVGGPGEDLLGCAEFDEFPEQESEFLSTATVGGKVIKVSSALLSEHYNRDECNPRDGELVKAADDLAAFIEALTATQNGSVSRDLENAKTSLREKYKSVTIGGISLGAIYADF